MSRAIVFNGDETWEMRELSVPDPQPGGAILRVEATGLCHSDVDHFRARATTLRTTAIRSPFTISWGGLVVLADDDASAHAKAKRLGASAGVIVGGPETVAGALRAFVDAGADW